MSRDADGASDVTDAGDDGYDEFLDGVAAGEGFYLACPNGHGSLPPRRVCPHCGATDLDETPLPETGTVETFTTVHVAVPSFEAETPYTTAIASFGPVRLTGVVRGGGAGADEGEAVEIGRSVRAAVDRNATTGDPVLVFRPA